MTNQGRTLAVMRWTAAFTAVVALSIFVVAFAAELISPGSERTKALFWAGVISLLFAMVLLASFAAVLSRYRGLSAAERSLIARYWLWGGPIGLFWVVWTLSDSRKKPPFFSK